MGYALAFAVQRVYQFDALIPAKIQQKAPQAMAANGYRDNARAMKLFSFCVLLSAILCGLLALTGHDLAEVFIAIGMCPLIPLDQESTDHD